ncbi:MAG: secretin and TonB N-terminal domain-containing protein [Planctomycetaceae bacterium]|nr:secretin and TonB N-terminal domain-containing protein [Planctomycetaceae bacterium]
MNRTFSTIFWTLCPGIALGLIVAASALGTHRSPSRTARAEKPKPAAQKSKSQTARRTKPHSTPVRQVSAEAPSEQPESENIERPVFFQLVKEEPLAPSPPSATDLKLQQLQTQLDQLLSQKSDAADQQAEQMQRIMQQLQQQQLNQMELRLESLQSAVKQSAEIAQVIERGTALGNGTVKQTPTAVAPLPEPLAETDPQSDEVAENDPPAPESFLAKKKSLRKPEIVRDEQSPDGQERFSLQVRDTEIVNVLDMLGEIAGANIVPGPSVQGKITVNLNHVTLNEALQAILRSTGLVFEREGTVYYVSTPEEIIARSREESRLVTKVYRPQYISVQDLQILLFPMLSQPFGKIAVTLSPDMVGGAGGFGGAGASGGQQSSSGGASNGLSGGQSGGAGGNSQGGSNRLAQQDAILVRDFPEVIAQFDQIVAEMDVPPQQVHIEAMILSVKLDDTMTLGVNFALLNGGDNQLVVSGNGAALGASTGLPGAGNNTIVPQSPFSDFLADAAGLKYGFIRGDVSAFVSALENLTDTNLIATPQLMVLNKQKAQLIIGDRLSYSTSTFQNNQSIQNVNFVDAGTKLSLRPFVANDGLVRMEIHPERSSAVINRITGLPDIATTEVTSNVMVRDGTTIVIGGLIEEQITESQERIPLLGSLPVVGAAFRNKNEQTERRELIILITPRIVHEAQAVAEADAAKYENERRAQHFQDELAPANRRNLTRNHYNRALLYYERGELDRASKHIREAARQNKQDRQVLRLQEQIDTAIREQRRGWLPWTGSSEHPAADTIYEVETIPPNAHLYENNPLLANPQYQDAQAFETPEPAPNKLRWNSPSALNGN